MSTVLTTNNELFELIKKACKEVIKELKFDAKPNDELLTQTGAAQLLKVSIPTLNKMKENGLIPYSQIQRKIYFKKQDILTALQSLSNSKMKG